MTPEDSATYLRVTTRGQRGRKESSVLLTLEADLSTAPSSSCLIPKHKSQGVGFARFYASCLGNEFLADWLPGAMWGQQQGLANAGDSAAHRVPL